MSLTKTTTEDKIEIVGALKAINIREATIVKEDGVEISTSYNRRTIFPIKSIHDGSSWTHTDTDISGESAEVQGIANAVWTDEVKAAKKSANEANMQ